MKIVKAEEEYLEFSDGTTITSFHAANCCEYNYADFSQIDDLAYEWDFENPLSFEICDCGFRFGNKDKMVFVPCYSVQNGYYSYCVEIRYKEANGKEQLILDDVECEGPEKKWW